MCLIATVLRYYNRINDFHYKIFIFGYNVLAIVLIYFDSYIDNDDKNWGSMWKSWLAVIGANLIITLLLLWPELKGKMPGFNLKSNQIQKPPPPVTSPPPPPPPVTATPSSDEIPL